MTVHTHAHHQGARPGPGRKAIKQLNERLRREQRDEQQRVLEKALRYAIPRNDEGPPPRID